MDFAFPILLKATEFLSSFFVQVFKSNLMTATSQPINYTAFFVLLVNKIDRNF